MKSVQWVKVYLCNGDSIGTRCGYGDGRTHAEAVAHALELGKKRDPNAYFDGREVVFSGGCGCL